jgi:branched-chain amino acid transport system ATP-binding protein
MLLEAKNLSKTFGNFRALADASISVEGNAIVGLIGPNGAGKSTFFNCLAGTTEPASGKVLFEGKDLTYASPEAHARAGIGRTFQIPATFQDMSVLENVMVGAFLRYPRSGDARDHAEYVLALTGLSGQARLRAGTLGTPGRKRLEIARVLASGPKLMLFDEALAGLTPVELGEAIELLRKIHAMGIAMVIVEHIMEVILTLTKHVLVFNEGHVIASGKPEDVVKEEAVIEAYLGRGRRGRRS